VEIQAGQSAVRLADGFGREAVAAGDAKQAVAGAGLEAKW